MSLPRDSRTDAELLSATAEDAEAFALFYRRHSEEILRFFGSRTRDPESAADLMAETFAAALLGAPRYRARRQPAVKWLYGIANHKLADSLRRGRVSERARKRLELEPLALDDDDLLRIEELSVDGEAPLLLDLLEELPAEQRTAVAARVVHERSYEDIALDLECSQSVVRQRVSRGLRTLRHRVENGQ